MSKKPLYTGVYLAEITSHGHNLTREKKYPQFAANFRLTARYIDNEKDFSTYGVSEPGFVDWEPQDEAIDGYFCLFNSPEVYSEDTALPSYKQLKPALGWDGLSLVPFEGDTFVGKSVLVNIKENTYKSVTSLQVSGIAAEDAEPDIFQGGFRALGLEHAKSLDNKFQFAKPLPRPVSARGGASQAATPSRSVQRRLSVQTKPPVETAAAAGEDIPF